MFDMFNENNSSNYETQNSVNDSYSSSSSSNSNSNYSSSKKGFVISVGGSFFISEKILIDKINDFCNSINELSSEFNFVLVIGGGRTARNYQEAAKEMGANNFELDSIGIASTRLNAMLFFNKINNINNVVLTNVRDAKEVLNAGKIPIFGGLSEGQTTDAVASLIAEYLNFDFINLSNVDGIFDTDPNQNQDAILFKELSFNDMNYLLKEKLLVPGQHLFVDPQAASILSRSKIKSFFLNGNHLENFKNCLKGYDYKGTIVSDISDVIQKENTIEEKFSRVEVDEENEEFEQDYSQDQDDDEEIDPRKIDFGKGY